MTDTTGRGPGVVIPPPFYFVAGFLAGWLLDNRLGHLWPSITGSFESPIDFMGGLMLGVGLGLAFWGIATFRRVRTPINPTRDASVLVIAGPYRITRNPMYTGLTIAYIGLALMLRLGWSLVMLPVVLGLVYQFVIMREEAYLITAFGDQYRQYQQNVRRWL